MELVNPERFKLIPPSAMPDDRTRRLAHRLNALGSLFYFNKIVLRKRRFSSDLHKYMCSIVECEHLCELIEIPRGCFKSTTYTEGAPMWWALPFNDADEAAFRKLGYGNEFIRWMHRAHDQNTRTMIVSSNLENAVKLGTKIAWHYTDNDLFREIFPETIPDSSCKWTEKSLEHKRTKKDASPNGEGTYDFIGVGGAAQSRHYPRVVQDDLVGRDALDSEIVMEDTINYHRLIPGLFDRAGRWPGYNNDEIVVGNRWSYRDLNQWIRENEPWFKIHSHSILGGCCPEHPAGKIIFPEEFTHEILSQECIRFGLYYYSCQYLNQPVSPDERRFKKEWLRYYNIEPYQDKDRRATLRHEVTEGEVIKDLFTSDMKIVMIVDPNHAGNTGRCRHAITVHGIVSQPTFRWYLLDCWAEACAYEKFVEEIFRRVNFWKLREFHLETIAAQKYLKLYLNLVKKRGTALEYNTDKMVNSSYVKNVTIQELKIDYSPNAKERRIEAMNPFFGERRFWVRRGHVDSVKFVEEYEQYPQSKLRDILDTTAYLPQVLDGNITVTRQRDLRNFLKEREQQYLHDSQNYTLA